MAEPDAAVAIVRARTNDSVLLMRRAERDSDSWSGHWSFPGGRRDAEDPDLMHTALRELGEECGIRLARAQWAATLHHAVARRRVGRHLVVAPFVFDVDDELPPTLHLPEAVEAVWVPLSVLRDPARHVLRRAPRLPAEARFPAIDLNGVPLWGFTYRLITDWLGLNPERPEEAGFETARELLHWLVTHGCELEHEWVERVAAVRGRVPVDEVLRLAAQPAEHIPRINMLEVRPDAIRLVGLLFEEYLIRASG